MSNRLGRKTKKKHAVALAIAAPPPREVDDAERSLARTIAVGLPVACVATAVLVGVFGGVGSALLVGAAGALLGTIALLWASVRTLSGDAPLPVGLEAVATRRYGVDALSEQKRRVLRALKDLESEHALGKIDDADYAAFVERYRDEAKTVMRQMDLEVGPLREEAERVAREYLQRKGLDRESPGESDASAKEGQAAATEDAIPSRRECDDCGASNERDASFCKQCGARMARDGEMNDADA
jgi:hypothetical protein